MRRSSQRGKEPQPVEPVRDPAAGLRRGGAAPEDHRRDGEDDAGDDLSEVERDEEHGGRNAGALGVPKKEVPDGIENVGDSGGFQGVVLVLRCGLCRGSGMKMGWKRVGRGLVLEVGSGPRGVGVPAFAVLPSDCRPVGRRRRVNRLTISSTVR